MLQIALFHSFYGWVIFHCVWIFPLAIVLNLFVCACQFSGVLPIFGIILLESHLFLKILARIVFFKDLCIWELDYKESWVPKIDTFELWCWRRLLRVPWTARRSKQSILKEISPECSLEGLMLKLKLQYFGHLMQRTDSLEKTLMLGKNEGRRRGWQGMRWLDGITSSVDMS